LSSHFCIPISTRVPPASGVIFDGQRGRQSGQVAERARLARLNDRGRRDLHRLDFEGRVAVEERAQLSRKLRGVGLNARVESALHNLLCDSFRALFYDTNRRVVRRG
jgi:hypothetical protein